MNTQEVIRSSALELLNDMIEENPLLINYLVHSTDFLEKIEANFLNSFSKYVNFYFPYFQIIIKNRKEEEFLSFWKF